MGYPIRTGVYVIQSISHPERVYVGSGLRVDERWVKHKRALKINNHHSIKLQRHYNKYGIEDLIFWVLEEGDYIDKNHLLARENGWFYHFKYKNGELPYFNTVNIAISSYTGDTLSLNTQSLIEELKNKKNKVNNIPVVDDVIKSVKVPNPPNNKGKGLWKLSEEECLRRSERMKNSPHRYRGKKLPKETTDKMSLSRIGKVQSEETKFKRVIATQETKKKKKIALIINSILNNKIGG